MPTRLLIEDGIIPDFFLNRLTSDGSYFPTQILLNPFEFFIFHFCYHLVDCSKPSSSTDQANFNPSSILYIVLLEVYLSFFSPIEPNKIKPNQTASQEAVSHSPASLWQSLSSTTSILLNLSPTQNSSSPLPKSSLLNLKALVNQSADGQSNTRIAYPAMLDPLTSSFKFEIVLNIFIEMWLNVKSSSLISKKIPSPTQLHSSFIQNPDHMRCVRIMVKHFHYFSNSLLLKKSLINQALFENSELDEIKRNIWSDKFLLQRRLYTFIRVAFEKWPLDSSFRLPLEIWLSFIQPWRYIDSPLANKMNEENFDSENKDGARQEGPVDKSWQAFISDNILFYSVVFRQLIPRFMRLDLGTSKNAFMLFRVIKVFFQINLAEMIKEAEENLEMSFSSSRAVNIRTSLLSPRHSMSQNPFNKNSLLECEAGDFVFVPLFSSQSKSEVKEFINTVYLTRNSIIRLSASAKAVKSNESFSLKTFFKSFSTQDDFQEAEEKMIMNDKLKTKNYLNIIIDRLAFIFDIDSSPYSEETALQSSDEMSLRSRQVMSPSGDDSINYSTFIKNSANPLSSVSPISPIVNRNEVKMFNTALKGKIEYQGMPDTQPIRSYEFEVLVKLFQFISQFINNRYSLKFRELYYRHDFVGALSRQILEAPTSFTEVEKQGALLPPRRRVVELGPRISLRRLSSKALYSYLLILYCIFYLVGFGKWTFLIIMLFFVCFYIVLKAIITINR